MAKATFVQKGDNIDFTAAADIAYMDVVTLTDRIGVALENIANGATGTVTLTGVFEFPAATGPGKGKVTYTYADKGGGPFLRRSGGGHGQRQSPDCGPKGILGRNQQRHYPHING